MSRLLKFQRKEDLGLFHNELNYMQTCWTVGYVISQIPSNMVLTRVRPSLWIPSMEVCSSRFKVLQDLSVKVIWTVLTFSICRCTSARQVYVFRFFIGQHAILIVFV